MTTKQEKLKYIIDKVHEVLPETMEFKKGCRFYVDSAPNFARSVELLCINRKNGIAYFSELDGSVFSVRTSKFKVYQKLGHPLYPHTLVRALGEHYALTGGGEILLDCYGERSWVGPTYPSGAVFRVPNLPLPDQSDEVIELFYQLFMDQNV